MAATRLRLGEILRDSRIQPRERINGAIVDEYAEAMAKGAEYAAAGLTVRPWPPIVVFHERDDAGRDLYWLGDGWHRVLAAERVGHEEVEVEVREGDRDAALLHAASANAEHGLRRTTADKRRAVWLILDHPTVIAEQWGNGRLAHHAGVSLHLVRSVRAEREARLGMTTPGRRGKDGKLYHRGLRLRGEDGPESPLAGSGASGAAEPTSDPDPAVERLLIHQCRTEGCDAVTTEPSWHCPTCGTHWPLPESGECAACTNVAPTAPPLAIFATVTEIDVPRPERNGHAAQAPYTPGRLGPPPASLALEKLRLGLDLLDAAFASGVGGAEILAACDDPAALAARVAAMRDELHAMIAAGAAV